MVRADKSAVIRINLTKWRWILCRGDGILSGGQVEWRGAGRARFAMHEVCAYGGVPPAEEVPWPSGALSTNAGEVSTGCCAISLAPGAGFGTVETVGTGGHVPRGESGR